MDKGHASLSLSTKIYFYDTDAFGVAHNIAYLRLVEQGRTELAIKLGWPLQDMHRSEHGCPVVVKTEIDYLRPARLGDEIEVYSQLIAVGKVRFQVDTEIRHRMLQHVFCKCLQTLASVNAKTGKPMRLREDWISAFQNPKSGED